MQLGFRCEVYVPVDAGFCLFVSAFVRLFGVSVVSGVFTHPGPIAEDATGRTAVEIVHDAVVAPPLEMVLSDISLVLCQCMLVP